MSDFRDIFRALLIVSAVTAPVEAADEVLSQLPDLGSSSGAMISDAEEERA